MISWLPWGDTHHEEATLSVRGDEESLPEREIVQVALMRMKPEYAICLILRLGEGFSSEETAHILHVSPEAVRMRLSRARLMFKNAYMAAERDGLP